ncbi:MAG: GNAT family N-acetyltransferase [Caldimonas sp.]
METLAAGSLVLEPLVVAHAEAMFELLSDPEIHRYLDHPPPPSIGHLRGVYGRLESRQSPDGRQRWLNWVLRSPAGSLLGYVQATVTERADAWVAYILSRQHWGGGHAAAAMQAMLEHLKTANEVRRFLATVEAENLRSIRLLERLGFHPATALELDGQSLSESERLFVCQPSDLPTE